MGNGFSGSYNFDNDIEAAQSKGYYTDNDGFDDDFDELGSDFDDFDDFDDDLDYNDNSHRMNTADGRANDEFDDDFDDGYDDYYDDEYDDYYDDEFDDFDDGYNRPMPRQSRQRQSHGYSDYDDFGDDFSDAPYYADDRKRSQSAARNVIPPDNRSGRRHHETQSERYDRYAEDLRKKRKRMGAPAGKTGDFYDYDTSEDYDDYKDTDGYYGRDFGPADRTPEPIPPIYAKYLGTGDGSYYEETYGKTAKKNNAISVASYKAKKRLKTLGIVAGCFAAAMMIAYYFTFVRMYNPVEVSNSLVNLQTADSTKMLQGVIGNTLENKSIRIIVQGEQFVINLGDYGFNYSSSAEGSTSNITAKDDSGKDVEQVMVTFRNMCYNQTKLEALLDSIAGKYGTVMKKPSYEIDGDKLTITAGTDGVGIDENSLIKQILDRIQANNFDENLVEEMVVTKTPEVNIDKIYKEVVCDVKDATSYVDSNGETIYNADVVGKKFDLESARSQIENGGNTWTINMKLTQPKVTLVELKAPTCPDLLAETTTEFNAGNKTRAANIKNAVNRINTFGNFEDGYVLQPGEIFSFNDTVGERTEANGFSIATVYTTTGTANDVGGGICQVSSTIFSAAFKADLEITQRYNHFYIVHYWPTKGEDATVNWGTLDFRFMNSKAYPIKIKLTYSNSGKVSCKIMGTQDGYRAEFDNKVLKQYLTGKEYKKATTGKPKGKIEYGDPGYDIEIYKVRYFNDKKISKELMWTSHYEPLKTVVYQ